MAEDHSTNNNGNVGPEGPGKSIPVTRREAEVTPCKCKCEKQTYFTQRTKDIISLVTLIALGVYTAVTILILCNSQYQSKIIRNQLTLAYPPKLLVTNVAIWPATGKPGDPVNLLPKAAIKGKAWLVNVGAESTALGKENPPFDSAPICVTFWGVGPLPMVRPYDAPTPNTKPCDFLQLGDGQRITVLRPGEFGYWTFEAVAPDNYTPAMNFYVLGYVIHHDQLGVRHLTLFARRYDPSERRFKAVEDNHDYEGYE